MNDPFDDGRARALTGDQAQRVEAWLRRAGLELGLHAWDIHASPFECERSADATAYIQEESDEIWVAVARDFPVRDADDQRVTLTHELLHAYFHRVSEMTLELIETELGKRTEAVIRAATRVTEERAVDRLARSVAKWLPLVDIGERGIEAQVRALVKGDKVA